MTFIKKKLFIFFIVLINNQIYAENRTFEELETALVLKLCDYVIWNNDSIDFYTIGLFTSNKKLISNFKSYTNTININNKKIEIKEIKDKSEIVDVNILYIDEKNKNQLSEINTLIQGKNILLFTENHNSSNEIMFNILTNNEIGTISFEFNKANLIFEGFDIHPKIIELRGSEIDVRELYRQTKKLLDNQETIVKDLSREIIQQKKNIEIQTKIINDKNSEIELKNKTIENQIILIDKKESHLQKINKKLHFRENEIIIKERKLKQLQIEVESANKILLNNKQQIKDQFKKLENLNLSIQQKQQIIINKDNILEKKEIEINYRNKTIIALFLMSAFTLVLLFLIFRANKANKKAKIVLANQKEELESTLEKLTLAQDQLIQSEKMASLGILVAGIAHEINNPVNFISTGIIGIRRLIDDLILILSKYREKYSDKIENSDIKALEEELDINFLLTSHVKMYSNIKSGIDRTVNIIQSLKLFSHENDKLQTIDIHENLDLALTILHNQYKYKIEIVKNYNAIHKINCYPGKINQVFVNLITNSIQAIKEKGIIEITTKEINHYIEIKIKDNGSGIPENIKNKIFDPFFTTKEVGKGTGLGLSLVYNIIQKHNGEINLHSEEGKFTEFIIKLPILNNTNKL